MEKDRTTLLKRMSDAFFPRDFVNFLSGTVFLKIGDTGIINGWTFIHFISGMISGFVFNGNVLHGLIAHSLWETFQFFSSDNKLDFESVMDIAMDTLAFYLGFLLYNYLSKKKVLN